MKVCLATKFNFTCKLILKFNGFISIFLKKLIFFTCKILFYVHIFFCKVLVECSIGVLLITNLLRFSPLLVKSKYFIISLVGSTISGIVGFGVPRGFGVQPPVKSIIIPETKIIYREWLGKWYAARRSIWSDQPKIWLCYYQDNSPCNTYS